MLFRRFLIGVFLLLLAWSANAQVGNEWINFSQFYFKVSVAKDGLYRLTYNDLQNSGFPVDAVDPRRLQIFHRGVEQDIYVQGEADAKFDAADFLEFYGRKNDGTLDAELYQPSSAQPHAYYNLYNDTTAYFLSYNPLAAGHRMNSFQEVNITNIPKEVYHTDEKLQVLTDSYAVGVVYDNYFRNTFFDQGEGWSGDGFGKNQSIDYVLSNILQGVSAISMPSIEIQLLGRGSMAHSVEISVGPNSSSLRLLTTQNFNEFTTYTITQSIDWTDIGSDGNLTIHFTDLGVGGAADRISVSYIKLTYPQSFDFGGATEKLLQLAANPSDKSYVEFVNPPAGLRLFDITDPNHIILIGTNTTPVPNAVVNGTSTSRKILATSVFSPPPSIKPVSFRQITPAQHDYIIISNRVLMQPGGGYADPVTAYGAYRASVSGGAYDTLVVDVNQLYDQFNYGELSPLAIHHFMKYMVNSGAPKYLFLIGKGLDPFNDSHRNPSSFPTYKDLVPSGGSPSSDILFTAGLSGTFFEPAVPTGRIPANTPADVAAYLNKVKEMEAQPFDNLWRKDILHLSGGINAGEPEIFRQYVEGFEAIARSFHLGGNVSTIAKQSTDIKFINIKDEVNAGLNLVTFFGHSSSATTDFDIGFVTDPTLGYNNPGKYIAMLINGCNAGDFFLNTKLFGEDWITAANKGAVSCIAHTSYGTEGNLKKYSDIFYEVGYGDSTFIYKGIGDIQKEVVKRYMQTASGSSVPDVTQVHEMLLLADPAVHLFGARKSDYEVNDNNLFVESFDGTPVTALSDSFAVRVIVRNFGQAKEDTILLELIRTFNDNSTETYSLQLPPVLYSDTLTFVIKKGRTNGFGNNSFKVTVDADHRMSELNENNNEATHNFFMPLNSTKNLFPRDYAIVNTNAVTLSFQSTDLLSSERNFTIELDTTDTFNSPFKKQFTTTGAVLAKQNVALLTRDSTAYYWRTKFSQPLPGESAEWQLSSFTFINNGPEGWAQAHFPQYQKNEAIGLVKDFNARRLKFQEVKTDIVVKTYGANNPALYTDVSVKIDDAEYNLGTQNQPCRNNTINLIAFNKTTTVPYPAIPFNFQDPRTCGREPQVIVSFGHSEVETGNGDDLIKYIDNVAIGDSVVLFNIGDAGYGIWSSNVKSKLGALGISLAQIDALQTGEPVVIFAKKGAVPGTAVFFRTSVAPVDQQALLVSGTITGRYTSGKMNSVLIGPAQHWQQFVKQTTEVEGADKVTFDLIGVKLNGKEEVLQTNITTDLDLSNINATDYPNLKVVFNSKDSINLTSPQLRKWLVLYEPVAEGLLIFKGPPTQQALMEGQDWTGEYGFVNISDKMFSDSLSVHLEAYNKTTRTSLLKDIRIKAPAPADTTYFNFVVDTRFRGGLNDVNVFVNPHILPEQYYENNVLNLIDYLNVQTDLYKPVLEVTIDGRFVVNDDYVSPNPIILMKLWDENKIVLKTDTTGVTILLTYPCANSSCAPQKIYFSQDDVKWFPATDTSSFRVEFTPKNLPEGEYTLSVNAEDGNGNLSGLEPYEVTFNVKYESSVTFLDPYPNPSNTDFYFTTVITGTELPQYFDLQIMTVEGQTVNEFHLTAGDFHIGTNDLYWNGKNASGNDLPSGFYIYRLTMNTSNTEIKKNGKLVLTR